MRILHLTDFHYQKVPKYDYDQTKVVEAIVNSIENKNIDYIFFTGDLVNDGSSSSTFLEAKDLLLNPLLQKTKDNAVFLCAGNHDLHRYQEMPAIKTEIEKIKTIKDLDDFASKNPRQFKESLTNFINYNEFIENFYSKYPPKKEELDEVYSLYTIHKRVFNGKKIGIVAINSAWRAIDSEKDRGNLYFPLICLKEALSKIKDVDFKILIQHHNLSDYKDFVSSELEDIIFNEFHLLLTGHYHRQKQSSYLTDSEGIFCSVSSAALSLYDKHSELGYSIIDIDIDTFEVLISIYNYNTVTNTIEFKKKLKGEIPLNQEKREQNEIRKTIRKRYKEECEQADELFVSGNEEHHDKTFLSLFTNPILKSKSKTEIAGKKEDVPTIPIDNLTNSTDNFIIFGKDKSGKTSLLWKIKLDILKNYSTYKSVPFYIDCRNYKMGNSVKLINLLSRYLEINKSKTEAFIAEYQFCILLDNFDPSNSALTSELLSVLKECPNSRFIAATEETILRAYGTIDIDKKAYRSLFIHEITRREIRTLTQKWSSIPENRKDVVIDKITQIFSQLNMPTNYWTVSLFLWIFEKTNETNFHNNFELIQLYIDGILDRKNFVIDKNIKIEYEDLKSYLGALAHFLIKKHFNDTCAANYEDIINFTTEYRTKHRKFVAGVEPTFNMLKEKGIIKLNGVDKYTFRLNGVFEYFLAYHMTNDKKFKDEVLNDDHFYLSFSNELELYSGFNKKDEEFLKKIYEKTKCIYNNLSKDPDYLEVDRKLLLKMGEIFDFTPTAQQISASSKAVLSMEEQDRLMEEYLPTPIKESEVEKKKYYEHIDENAENLEKALFILSRVYRNSILSDDCLENEILDFVLNAACNLGFKLLDESDELIDINKDEDSNGQISMKLMANFLPLIIETFLFDALAQNNLERIILDKIDELKQDSTKNQLKLFILYFMLIDLDIKNCERYIDKICDLVKLGILKQSILMKLCTYLIFKSNNNSSIEKMLRDKIQQISVSINAKIDVDKLQTNLKKNVQIQKIKRNKQ
ncbi:metallophosphoesterase family protein [Bacteroides thetaiotaomicron]|jgi:hypothetical protein|uniref:metallophosphoesterase family protein n=1 Tax=Bacteroides thetaiotaomicron TaxID=818 RepID=UPI001C37B0F3|nr:metallophosphoesterase [Bacteroides thetaiotaomicron]MBV3728991.1 metallophosphoesterase [Bacteroides thetaiotaomicron]